MKRIGATSKNANRQLRHVRVRQKVAGTAAKPRLSVFRGVRSMVAQLIDDTTGKTICAATTKEVGAKKVEGKTTKVAAAYLTGQLLAERAVAQKITQVSFDRGGYKYHGRVAALADGARAGGLQF